MSTRPAESGWSHGTETSCSRLISLGRMVHRNSPASPAQSAHLTLQHLPPACSPVHAARTLSSLRSCSACPHAPVKEYEWSTRHCSPFRPAHTLDHMDDCQGDCCCLSVASGLSPTSKRSHHTPSLDRSREDGCRRSSPLARRSPRDLSRPSGSSAGTSFDSR